MENGSQRGGAHARCSCTKTALTLIYISRNTAARGGGSTRLWDALTVRYQQQHRGGGGDARERERERRRKERNLEEC